MSILRAVQPARKSKAVFSFELALPHTTPDGAKYSQNSATVATMGTPSGNGPSTFLCRFTISADIGTLHRHTHIVRVPGSVSERIWNARQGISCTQTRGDNGILEARDHRAAVYHRHILKHILVSTWTPSNEVTRHARCTYRNRLSRWTQLNTFAALERAASSFSAYTNSRLGIQV